MFPTRLPTASLLALAFLLAGCTSSGPSPGMMALCWVTQWSEDGAFDRALLPEPKAGYRLTFIQPPDFVAFESLELDARWGHGNYAFSTAVWPRSSVSNQDPTPTFSFYVWDQAVRGDVPAHLDTSAVRSAFLQFARNLTAAGEAQLQTWADQFMEQRKPEGMDVNGTITSWDHQVTLIGPYRLEALVQDLEARSASVTHDRPGLLSYALAGWNVTVSLATKQVKHETGAPRVDVDVGDRVAYYAIPKGRIMEREEGWAARNETYEALGWNAPQEPPTFVESGEFCTPG
jgi:hypothetical protein